MAQIENWDAIAIGSGLGALAAACASANRRKRVLVLERLANFGGAATIYRHDNLTMEASLHETDGDAVFNPNGLFARLGLGDTLEPLGTDIFYETRGGPLRCPVPVAKGLDEACEAVSAALPDDARHIARYFRELERIYEGVAEFEAIGAGGPSALLSLLFSGRLFTILARSQQSVSDRFDAYFGKREGPKFVLGAPIAYFDDDPAMLSYLGYAAIFSRYTKTGGYYFKGGSAALTKALIKRVQDNGGQARRSTQVKEIVIDDTGKAAGVVYETNKGERREAFAPVIFGGAAPRDLADMLPEPKRAEFLQPYEGFQSSISLFTLSLGLARPAAEFGVAAYSTFIYPENMVRFSDYPRAVESFGGPPGQAPPYVVADYSRLETGLEREGDWHLLTITGVDRLSWWEGLSELEDIARREAWTRFLIADLDRHFPGIADAVKHSEMATAGTMHRRLGTPNGEVYGFRPTAKRLFGGRPSAATSVEGLWLSSAYTVSGGYTGAMQGGLMAADAAWRRG